MTDEEKAEEYVKETFGERNWAVTETYKNIYLEGLAEGRKELEKEIEVMQEGEVARFECWHNRLTELEKENEELKKENSILRNDVRVAREDRERLQLKVGKGLQEFIHDCPYSALKFYASEKLVEENEELNRDKTELVNSVTELESKVTELEKQIEKMKN